MRSDPAPRAFTLPLLCFQPPYALALPMRDLPVAATSTPLGAIAAVRVEEPACDELAQGIRRLRRRCPWLPVVLSVPQPSAAATRAAVTAVRAGARGVVFDGEPIHEALCPLMTEASTLGEDVIEWLGVCRLRLTPPIHFALREIFLDPFRYACLERLLEALGESPRSMRAHFRKGGLSSPHRWFAAARALRSALAVQGTVSQDLLHVALELGLCDHSTLSQQIHRVFGLRPSRLRMTLGWEWLMFRFLSREVAAPPARARDHIGIPGRFHASTVPGNPPSFTTIS